MLSSAWGHLGVHFFVCSSISLFFLKPQYFLLIFINDLGIALSDISLIFFTSWPPLLRLFWKFFWEPIFGDIPWYFLKTMLNILLTNTMLYNFSHHMSLCMGHCWGIFGPILGSVSQCLEIFLSLIIFCKYSDGHQAREILDYPLFRTKCNVLGLFWSALLKY